MERVAVSSSRSSPSPASPIGARAALYSLCVSCSLAVHRVGGGRVWISKRERTGAAWAVSWSILGAMYK
ncbi:hypothetical protein VPHD529_0008 [Vibrio phage D529]